MAKEHFKATDTGGEELAPERELMGETEMLALATETIPFDYPATPYRTMHPDTVNPADIANMNDEEFNDFLVALNLIEDYRTIPKSARPSSRL